MTTERSFPLFTRNRLILLLLALLVPGLLFVFLQRRAQQQKIAEEQAALPPLEQVKVAALGRVEPAGGIVNVASPLQGVVSRLLVDTGDQVLEGQTLAFLNLYEVRLAERDFAESQLIEAEEALNAQVQVGNAQILEADTRVSQVDLPQAEAVRSQQAQIRELQAQLNVAEIDLRRFETLAAQGAIAQQQLDLQRAEVAQIRQRIAAGEATLVQLESARSANLDNANAQVSAAEANLRLSQATAGVRSAQRNLALAEANLAQTILLAPSSGQVIEVFVDPGESVENQAVLSLGNTEEMQVVAEVIETDIGLVEVGQSATIRSRNGAFEETLTGTVSDVARQIFKNDVLDDDPAANADARVVEVDITVDQPDVIDSLTNLQVDVVIDIDEDA